MPILQFHLVDGQYADEQLDRLLREGSAGYAEVLGSPVERVRAFVTLHPPHHVATGGVPVGSGGEPAPYVTFLVLAGRPREQRQRLIALFTDLVVDVLGARRELVRVHCIHVDPEDWGIGGVPASAAREAEVRARAEQLTATWSHVAVLAA